MNHQIQKDIPVAGIFGITGRPKKYPIEGMNVGDSFAVPAGRGPGHAQGRIVWCISYYKRKNNWSRKYVTRTVVENGRRMVRCWRTE